MLRSTTTEKGTPGAFVLIELALAVFLLATVVLAAFALLARSLKDATATQAETRATQFAEGVLDGIRSLSVQAAETNGWESFWNGLSDRTRGIPLPIEGTEPGAILVRAAHSETLTCHTVTYPSFRTHSRSNRVSHTLWYRLQTGGNPALQAEPMEVWLDVWTRAPGTNSASPPFTFYTQYPRVGDL
jgi:hypothetical protein